MKHVMLDLETLGTRPGCVILSIGACKFDPYGSVDQVMPEFYATLSIDEQTGIGQHIDPGTKRWWENQNQEAWRQATADPQKLDLALPRYLDFFKGGRHLWSHGAGFDIPLLENLLGQMSLRPNWRFWDNRDTRTIYDLAGINLKSFPREGTYHNALDDAKHQAKAVITAYGILKRA